MLVPGASGTVGVGSTSVTAGLPAGMVTGQLVFQFVVTKPDTATIVTPTDWTSRGNRAGGGGTNGVDTGPTRAAVLTRVKDTGWSTMPAVSVTSGNASAVLAAPYLPAAGSGTDIASTDGEYTGNGTAWSATMAADPGIQEGDRIIVFCSNQSDGPTWSAQSLSVPGCVLSPVYERSEAVETTTGNDVGGMVCEFFVRSGTSTGAATFTATTSAASRGVTIMVRVRETSVPSNLIEGVEPEAACGFVGPLMDSNGNLYRLTEEYLGPGVACPEFGNHPMIEKSTNGGVTWKRMDSTNGPGYGLQGSFNDMESAWLVQRTGKKELVVLWEKATSRWWGAVFRTSDHATSPDTWDTGSIGTSSGVETFAATIAAESGIAGVSLSDGTVRAFIRGTVQGGFESFAHRVMAASGTSWDLTPAYITDGVHITRPSAVVANSDTTYLLYRDHTNGQVRYKTISSTGTVSASARVDSGGAGAGAAVKYENNVVPPVYYDDAGTPVVVVGFVNASDQLRTVEIRGGVVGSEQVVSTNVLTVNPLDLGGSSTDSQGPAAALAVIGTTLYAFWGEVQGTSGDVYYATRTNGGSWSARQLFYDTGTGRECQWLYAKAISATKIAVSVDAGRHFDDDSNIFYTELTVGGLGGALTPAIETDAAQPLARTKRHTLTPATETDGAQPIGRTKRIAITPATETDTAVTVGAGGPQVAPTVETDTAVPLGRTKRLSITPATETDVAQSLPARKSLSVTPAAETDTAPAITRRKARPVSPAAETDAAQALARRKRRTLDPAVETDTAVTIAVPGGGPLPIPTETDLAVPLVRIKRRAITPATETETATGIARRKRVAAAVAVEQDTSVPVDRRKARSLTAAVEVETAVVLARLKRLSLAPAAETDAAIAIVSQGGVAPRNITVSGHILPATVAGELLGPTLTGRLIE